MALKYARDTASGGSRESKSNAIRYARLIVAHLLRQFDRAPSAAEPVFGQ